MPLPVDSLLKQRVTCSDVVRCAFDLGDHEIRVYDTLNDLGTARVEDVARAVRREESVVYRNLQKLIRCGIVEKEKETIAGGGYYFVYRPLPKSHVKKKLAACVDDWHGQMRSAISRL